VRRPVLHEAVVILVAALAPSTLGVITGLLGQDRRLFRVKVDLTLSVVIAIGLVQDAHD
jgi:hypothetical protein